MTLGPLMIDVQGTTLSGNRFARTTTRSVRVG